MKYTSELARPIAERFRLREEDVTWALESTMEHLLGCSRVGVARWKMDALQTEAVELLIEWLERGAEWALDASSPARVAEFVRAHAPACVWAVLQAQAINAPPLRGKRDPELAVSQLVVTITNQLITSPPPGTRRDLITNLARTIATALDEYGYETAPPTEDTDG